MMIISVPSGELKFAIYHRLRIGRDDHLDQSEAYDVSQLVYENTWPDPCGGHTAIDNNLCIELINRQCEQ